MPTTSDPALGARLERDGYAVVRLIDAGNAAALRAWWLAEDDGLGPQQFRSSIMSPNQVHRQRAHAVVSDALLPAAWRLLPGFRPCLGSFTVKLPGQDGEVQLHQDWTFVDESRWWSLGFWCALQDVGPANGCLEVLPGSHLLRRGWRGADQECPLAPHEARLRAALVRLPLKAGEAVLFTQALIHASAPFASGDARVCASFLMLEGAAPLLHVRAGDGALDVWEVPDDYYLAASFGVAPPGTPRRVAATALDPAIIQRLGFSGLADA
jgi:hypothetical protein